MVRHKPTINNLGMICEHDQACAVHHDKPAVYNMGTGVFEPSWEAQKEGWALLKLKPKTFWHKILLRFLK